MEGHEVALSGLLTTAALDLPLITPKVTTGSGSSNPLM